MEERVQSVLVSAGTSNGPMLSHSPPHYNKQSECSESTDQYKDDFLHNGGKVCGLAFSIPCKSTSGMLVNFIIVVLLAISVIPFFYNGPSPLAPLSVARRFTFYLRFIFIL